jgi:anti-sigma B factor antagonist
VNDSLTFSTRSDAGTAVLEVAGRVDSSTSGLFEAELETVYSTAPQAVIIDLAQVVYMSSAALRVLLMAAKRSKAAQGRLVLCAMADNIREVFDISGFSAIFDIAGTQADARAMVGL